ncbi:hypothetical protein C3Y87_00195 [Carbonactinospora thermoautotrophica]|uniref:permease n=1 Tax=Carbonactinospora thermoautotrophica TaxID=1469144 RepID=UPI003DA83311|nr:hypothetical protein [Carbonactinospora thermoautotrophica]
MRTVYEDTSVAGTPAQSSEAVRTADKPEPGRRRRRVGALDLLIVGLLIVLIGQRFFIDLLSHPALQTWSTIFVSITVQALPFLVFGVVLSAAIAAFVPPSAFSRALPRRPALAVPVAGAAGMVLPGCECASVPVAGGLVARGVAPAAAFAFLLAAPAINPVVLTATAVAFPQQPEVVFARFLASLATSVVMGWLWVRFGRGEWLRMARRPHLEGGSKWEVFRLSMQHDFLHAGGFLVVGGLTAATLNVVVPRSVLDAVAEQPWLSVLLLAALAVVLAICSEADAFVAASLSQFSMTARLAFMVVGPAVDVKLIALQAGTFGRAFALRFAPATLVTAVLASVLVGWWLL